MATISWNGTPYPAEPVKELANGDWLMRMLKHGPRFAVGSIVQVKPKEIIELAAAEMPVVTTDGLAELQAAMDARPANMLTPAQILAQWHAGKLDLTKSVAPASPTPTPQPAAPAPISSVTQPVSEPPPSPPSPPLPISQPQDATDMSSKLAALPGLAKTVAANVEAQASATSDRLTKAQAGAAVAIDKLNTVAASVEKSTTDLEDVVNQLTNGGPGLGD